MKLEEYLKKITDDNIQKIIDKRKREKDKIAAKLLTKLIFSPYYDIVSNIVNYQARGVLLDFGDFVLCDYHDLEATIGLYIAKIEAMSGTTIDKIDIDQLRKITNELRSQTTLWQAFKHGVLFKKICHSI